MGLQFNTVPQQQNWGIGGVGTQEQASSTQTGPRGLLFGDSLQSIGSSALSFLYVQDIGVPILPAPSTSQSEMLLSNKDFLSNINLQIRSNDNASPYKSTYLKSFDSILEQAVQKNGLSKELSNEIVFAAMMGIPIPDNPQLNQILGLS